MNIPILGFPRSVMAITLSAWMRKMDTFWLDTFHFQHLKIEFEPTPFSTEAHSIDIS